MAMNMKNFHLYLAVTLFGTLLYGDDNVCYEYPYNSYILVNTSAPEFMDPKTKKFILQKPAGRVESRKYRLILAHPKASSRLYPHYFFLLRKENGTVFDFQNSECPSPSPDPERYYCYGECDSGIVSIERNGQVNFKTGRISFGVPITGTWELRPAEGADLPEPRPITCPSEIAKRNLDPNRGNEEHIDYQIETLVKPIRYICYASKKYSAARGKVINYSPGTAKITLSNALPRGTTKCEASYS